MFLFIFKFLSLKCFSTKQLFTYSFSSIRRLANTRYTNTFGLIVIKHEYHWLIFLWKTVRGKFTHQKHLFYRDSKHTSRSQMIRSEIRKWNIDSSSCLFRGYRGNKTQDRYVCSFVYFFSIENLSLHHNHWLFTC